MPAKNIVKTYIEKAHYHVYNRGVDKRKIFLDNQDCSMFLYYLRLYLLPIEELKEETLTGRTKIRFLNLNLSKEVSLLSFALMPNHFHLLLKQNSLDGITKLMKRIATAYVMYFNKKYKRLGPLFQNIYKSCLVNTDSYLLHLSRYIHLNSTMVAPTKINFLEFSSYPYYLNKKRATWIKPQEILDYFVSSEKKNFKDILSYQSFVEDYIQDPNQLENLTLEDSCI